MKNYEQVIPFDWKNLRGKLGGIYKTAQIKKFLIEDSYLPIFRQFVGVQGSGGGVLDGSARCSQKSFGDKIRGIFGF